MLIKIFRSIFGIHCIVCCSLFVQAQPSQNVNYQNLNKLDDIVVEQMNLNHQSSTYKSIADLRKNAADLKEGRLVDVVIEKQKKHRISAENIVKRNSISVLVVWQWHHYDQNIKPVEQWATAIPISKDGICVTNYHVLSKLIDKKYIVNNTDSLLFVSDIHGRTYPITQVLTYNKAADIAIFKVDYGTNGITPIPLGSDLPVGSRVHTLTHPQNLFLFYSQGFVARTTSTDEKDPFTNRVEITADYAKGSSGGPIFDDCGNLVAMVAATKSVYYIDKPQIDLQMTVKRTIPISSIRRLMVLSND